MRSAVTQKTIAAKIVKIVRTSAECRIKHFVPHKMKLIQNMVQQECSILETYFLVRWKRMVVENQNQRN